MVGASDFLDAPVAAHFNELGQAARFPAADPNGCMLHAHSPKRVWVKILLVDHNSALCRFFLGLFKSILIFY